MVGDGNQLERERAVLEKLRMVERAGFGSVYVQVKEGKITFVKQEINEELK